MDHITLKDSYMDDDKAKETIKCDVVEKSKLNKEYLHIVKSSPQSLHFKCKIKECHYHVTYNLKKNSFVWLLGQSIDSHNHEFEYNFKYFSSNINKKVNLFVEKDNYQFCVFYYRQNFVKSNDKNSIFATYIYKL